MRYTPAGVVSHVPQRVRVHTVRSCTPFHMRPHSGRSASSLIRHSDAMSMDPLPEPILALGVFTLREAVTAGITDLRRPDVVRLGREIFAVRGVEHGALVIAKAVCRSLPRCWISHSTAGLVWGLDLPESVDVSRPHVSRYRPANVPRTKAVRGHRSVVFKGEVVPIEEIEETVFASSPARVWLELASTLSVEELIEFGDHLVRHPRKRFEGRDTPHATIAEMRRFLGWHPRITGAAKAAAALSRIRVGADSVMETRLRLALIDAGLPEPALQVQLTPDDRASPVADLGYRGPRIAIDYDGSTHLTATQQTKDIRRDRLWVAAGWRHVTANALDAAERFSTLTEQVRTMLAAAA